ncbi:MAG: hypothetical protein ACM3S5_05155 [Rhodospirillales bacterium]
MGYAERKQAEVERKMEALALEFERWLKATAAGGPFPKHHTQVRAAVGRLEGFQEAVREILAEDNSLSTAREMARTLLAVHRIWEFFRSKLAQRYEKAFARYLAIADEFAWLCYQPVYEQARKANPGRVFKEPPLVYLNGGMSPFILTRDAGFQAEAAPRELISGSDFKQATSSLPFPVIGVPWNQVLHLPDALAIGHEVGHSVEADFDLEAALDAMIDEALEESGGTARAPLWKAWRSEVFADVCGCLAAGPPFVCALADFLLADPRELLARQPAAEPYPPENLRIRINVQVLRKMGFDEPAGRILAAWDAEYPLPAGQSCFAGEDAPAIAARFLDGQLEALGGSLRSALTFDATQYERARTQAQCALQGRVLKDYRDLRVMLAAARIAYATKPDAYYKPVNGISPAGRLEQKMESLLTSDLRSGERARTQQQQQQADEENRKQGKRDFERIFKRLP